MPGARPARLPTVDTSWQGKPPQRTSTGGTSRQSVVVMSPRLGGVGPVVGEDARDVLVVLGEPDRLGAQGVFDGEIESAVAAEQGAGSERTVVVEVVHEDSG